MKSDEKILGYLEGAAEHIKEVSKCFIEHAWNKKLKWRCIHCGVNVDTTEFGSLEEYEAFINAHSHSCVEKFLNLPYKHYQMKVIK